MGPLGRPTAALLLLVAASLALAWVRTAEGRLLADAGAVAGGVHLPVGCVSGPDKGRAAAMCWAPGAFGAAGRSPVPEGKMFVVVCCAVVGAACARQSIIVEGHDHTAL